MSDVPLGAFLSGGLDSATVVRHMARQSSRPRTFTIGFPGHRCDETPHAQAVSPLSHRASCRRADDVVAAGTGEQRGADFDEPFADASALPMILLSRIARESVTVTLSGDGGDELLGGYTRYRVNT